MMKSLLNSPQEFVDLSILSVPKVDAFGEHPAIIRRESMTPIRSDSDIFNRARNIFIRGRHRYPRKATGII
jgi:hypothetical protein